MWRRAARGDVTAVTDWSNARLKLDQAELRFTNGVSLIGKFDGEFSDRAYTLGGTGTLKYAW